MNTESYFLKKKPASPRGGSLSQSCQWPHTLLPSLRCRELQSCLIFPQCLPPWFPPPPQISSPPFPCLTIPTGLVFNGRPASSGLAVDCTKVSWVRRQNKLRQHLLTSCIPTPTFWTDKQSGSRSPMMVQKAVGKQRDESHHAKANLKTDMVGWWAIYLFC